MLPEQKPRSTTECACCHLVRLDKSSRLLLPLARRSHPRFSSRSQHMLCKNCLTIKQNQELHLIDKKQESNSKNIFETITDLNQISIDQTKQPQQQEQMIIEDIPHEIEFSLINDNEKLHLNNSEYHSSEMLVWKINQNQPDTSYDTGSLTADEKKILLEEAVQKLQIVLNNRSSSTTTSISDSDLEKIEFTYRALQTTVNILSTSLDSL